MGIFLVASFQYLHISTILCLFTGNYPSILKQLRGKYGEETSIPDKCCMPFPGNFSVNEPKLHDFTIGYTWALNNKDISKTSRGRA